MHKKNHPEPAPRRHCVSASDLTTTHAVHCADARDLSFLPDESSALVVTSPPYPMIQMWDDLFGSLSPAAADALSHENGTSAFEAMHAELDKVWNGLYRILIPGGFLCINIGDATRTLADKFALYPNHARIISACSAAGFSCLPFVHWKKATNAPNKFMGSGMLPAGAYVTLEHEYILIFRKGTKRVFTSREEKLHRMQSACFWEERNTWFSDSWSFTGVRQQLPETQSRERSAAFPFELARRLILMYSLYGDTVLDPFCGTGTTLLAALAAGRSSIAIEKDPHLAANIVSDAETFLPAACDSIATRLENHGAFATDRLLRGASLKYHNRHLDTPVMTRQETELQCPVPLTISRTADNLITVNYKNNTPDNQPHNNGG